MIITAGYNIAGPEVEQALLGHPDVAETGVVAAPDPERGTIVKAYVVLRDGAEARRAKAAELQAFANRRSRRTSTPARSSSSPPCPGPRRARSSATGSASSPPTAPDPLACQYAPGVPRHAR